MGSLPETVLPIEKPLVDLDRKLQELREKAAANPKVSLAGEIRLLEERLERKTRELFAALTPWQRVQIARHASRPVLSDYLSLVFDDFLEIHGDRGFRDDPAMATGFATIAGEKVLLVGHRKGKNTKERMATNFGMAHPEGYRKALRAMRLAEKFGLPIVTLINTPGAYPGIGAEERGQSQAIAQNLLEMSRLRTPIVCAVIGEGGSGGALGIGVGDRVLILENAYYSVISPEGCASILWKDAARAPDAAAALKLTAQDLMGLGLVDEIVPEPLGGAHRDPTGAATRLKLALLGHLRDLASVPVAELLARRYEKLRSYGRATLKGLEAVGAPVGAGLLGA
ncbi:MAG: acetyl-CoA carboxylase carboxyltransferase subunit alpha [Planctomycetales bacterium]|nr:acetyl-CoA carboxylase carboxyltransferase subunit alpha [Planctomycetales bacterium]